MIHIVTPGDTLAKIAKLNGMTLSALLDANPQFKASPDQIQVGDRITIPDKPVERNRSADTGRSSTDSTLGKLSEKFEVGKNGPATVSTGQGDSGGVSYGSYQMTSQPRPGRVGSFVSQPDFAFRDMFLNLTPGSKAFTAAWQQVAATNAAAFQDSQHTFIKRTHFDVLAAKILREDGLDINARSRALREVIWSTAVQHGPENSIVHVALSTLSSKHGDADFDKNLIIAIYAERGRKNSGGVLVHFSKNSTAVQNGVMNRFKNEQIDALNMLEHDV